MNIDLRGKRILVVDDSSTMRMLLSMTLRKTFDGIEVVEAVNGREGFEKLSASRFDLVLTDMQMPEMNGAELVIKIREGLGKSLPIVIITTKGEEADMERGMSLGANGYITKPISSLSLKDTVLKLLTTDEWMR